MTAHGCRRELWELISLVPVNPHVAHGCVVAFTFPATQPGAPPDFPVLPEIGRTLSMEHGISNHSHSTANASSPAISVGSAYSAAASNSEACPMCGKNALVRIRRRLIDRILSLFVRQRRFRCTQPGCQWQGNLRVKSSAQKRNTLPPAA